MMNVIIYYIGLIFTVISVAVFGFLLGMLAVEKIVAKAVNLRNMGEICKSVRAYRKAQGNQAKIKAMIDEENAMNKEQGE